MIFVGGGGGLRDGRRCCARGDDAAGGPGRAIGALGPTKHPIAERAAGGSTLTHSLARRPSARLLGVGDRLHRYSRRLVVQAYCF